MSATVLEQTKLPFRNRPNFGPAQNVDPQDKAGLPASATAILAIQNVAKADQTARVRVLGIAGSEQGARAGHFCRPECSKAGL